MRTFGICFLAVFTLCFTQLNAQPSSYKDPRDGKLYKTVQIGNQTWFGENLRFKTDGAVLPNPNIDEVGYLYSWETAQKSCPAGWHLPDENDWKVLITKLGGKYAAGGKMKSNSSLWKSPNKLSPASSQFDAAPAGTIAGGEKKLFSESALYWSSEAECTSANTVILNFAVNFVDKKITPKTDLLSVRCIKNQ
jgi:uncharacterized protein (TIGR02145 family)